MKHKTFIQQQVGAYFPVVSLAPRRRPWRLQVWLFEDSYRSQRGASRRRRHMERREFVHKSNFYLIKTDICGVAPQMKINDLYKSG